MWNLLDILSTSEYCISMQYSTLIALKDISVVYNYIFINIIFLISVKNYSGDREVKYGNKEKKLFQNWN